MRVVVTGHCGFVGAHVARILSAVGHEVTGIDREDPSNESELQCIDENDIDDADSVIHCAAHADVRKNWEPGNIDSLRDDNERALHCLLDSASRVRTIKSFVFVSSGAVYADQMSPYAASKLAGEAWCKAYADKFGWRLSIVRPAACYGEGYHHGHIVDFVKMAKETGRVTSKTIGYSRPALHVEDLADALVQFATSEPVTGTTAFMRGHEPWGCRDTVRVMGAEADWAPEDSGWLGDNTNAPVAALIGSRSTKAGVVDSLRSLGWECP